LSSDWEAAKEQTQAMDAQQTSEAELPTISIKELPGASKDELFKKQATLLGIAILVVLVCTAILRVAGPA
jgi:hypothetical protein